MDRCGLSQCWLLSVRISLECYVAQWHVSTLAGFVFSSSLNSTQSHFVNNHGLNAPTSSFSERHRSCLFPYMHSTRCFHHHDVEGRRTNWITLVISCLLVLTWTFTSEITDIVDRFVLKMHRRASIFFNKATRGQFSRFILFVLFISHTNV